MSKYMVYGVRAGSLLKIGMTNNVKRRMASLQNGSGVTITLVALWEFRDRGMAHAAEKHLHATFAPARRRGEWFEVRADEVNREMVKAGHLFLAQTAPAEPKRAVREGPPMVRVARNTRKYLVERVGKRPARFDNGATTAIFSRLELKLKQQGLAKHEAIRLAQLSTGRTRTFRLCGDGMYRENI